MVLLIRSLSRMIRSRIESDTHRRWERILWLMIFRVSVSPQACQGQALYEFSIFFDHLYRLSAVKAVALFSHSYIFAIHNAMLFFLYLHLMYADNGFVHGLSLSIMHGQRLVSLSLFWSLPETRTYLVVNRLFCQVCLQGYRAGGFYEESPWHGTWCVYVTWQK